MTWVTPRCGECLRTEGWPETWAAPAAKAYDKRATIKERDEEGNA